MSCISISNSFQDFPKAGELLKNCDLGLRDLPELRESKPAQRCQNTDRTSLALKAPGAQVYVYIITTVVLQNGLFRQKGSAPNFQGGLISLCTCKHKDRTWLTSWTGKWIAGFTSIRTGQYYLFYLTQVPDELESQFDLWHHYSIGTRTAKSASRSTTGDVYEPTSTTNLTRYDPTTYKTPVAKHVHLPNAWKKDIRYRYPGFPTKYPKLFVGDPKNSFLWTRPKIYLAPSASNKTMHHRLYPSLAVLYSDLIFWP